jgi:hypothetical protein
MAHSKRPKRRSTKSASPRKRTTHRKSRGFLGIPGLKLGSTNQIFDLLKKGTLIVVGFMGGQEIGRKVFNTEEGMKKYISPLIQAGGGYVLATQQNEIMKYVGYGLLGSGLVSGAGKAFGKDFVKDGVLGINGLRGLGDLRQLLSGNLGDDPNHLQLPVFNQFASPENFDETIETEFEIV